MWGTAARHGVLDVRFREKFQDALAIVISDQERAGLDILTNGDYHLDEDFAGRSWHHYPLQRWTGLEHEELQYERSRDSLLAFPPGTLLNEIETTWRWPRVVGKIEHARTRSTTPSSGASRRPARPRQARQVRDLLLAGDRRSSSTSTPPTTTTTRSSSSGTWRRP